VGVVSVLLEEGERAKRVKGRVVYRMTMVGLLVWC